MAVWGALILAGVITPWLVAAGIAGIGAAALAKPNARLVFAIPAAAAVLICGMMSGVVSGLVKHQLDALHYVEASTLCRENAVRILEEAKASTPMRFGAYERGTHARYKDLDIALRSAQTSPSSPYRNIALVPLTSTAPPDDDVFPVVTRITESLIYVSVIEPKTGRVIAYSNYLYASDSRNKIRYVACDREPSKPRRPLKNKQILSLLSIVAGPAGKAQRSVADKRRRAPREYDIEPATYNEVRESCSRGLTIKPGFKRTGRVRFTRSGDDLIVLVQDVDGWNDALSKKQVLAAKHERPVLWQYYYPVITCKDYLVDDKKAGPIFHPNGYEEPFSRVRGLTKVRYRPLDYGPHRRIECKDTLEFGGRAQDFAIRRDQNDLVISDYYSLRGETLKITPRITCKDYFLQSVGSTPNIVIGVSRVSKQTVYEASSLQALGDGEYLNKQWIPERLAKEKGEDGVRKTRNAPPVKSGEEHKPPLSSIPWPATPTDSVLRENGSAANSERSNATQ